jgi:hypothetical protein
MAARGWIRANVPLVGTRGTREGQFVLQSGEYYMVALFVTVTVADMTTSPGAKFQRFFNLLCGGLYRIHLSASNIFSSLDSVSPVVSRWPVVVPRF